jgi:hypothetical protein
MQLEASPWFSIKHWLMAESSSEQSAAGEDGGEGGDGTEEAPGAELGQAKGSQESLTPQL